MKKTDVLTPIGMAAGLILLVLAISSNAGTEGFASFLHLPSILIVLGGVTAALFVSFPLKEMKSLLSVSKQAFKQDEGNLPELIDTFVKLSERARREGLLSLEGHLNEIDDPFVRKGILLAIDGLEEEVIIDIMNAEIVALEERHRKGRSLLEKAGDYAPAWGMIGTLIGLVLMLKNLNEPNSLGPNMAIALLTTFYGVLLANLLFNPMAAKLEAKTEREIFLKQMIIEGVIGVQAGQNSRILEEKLGAFLSEEERRRLYEIRQNGALSHEA